ncbi:hypothetical protein [Pseudomonas viridiflava]
MTNKEILLALQHLIGTRYVPTVKAYITDIDRQNPCRRPSGRERQDA